MSDYINTIDKKRTTKYFMYETANPVIKFLSKRFLKKIKELLSEIGARDHRGLDVGCGKGHMINYLHENDVLGDLLAVDLDSERIDFAKEHYPVCNYAVKDIYNLELDTEPFDYVIATEILEHLPDPGKALEELKKVSKPNAYLVISVPFEPYFHWGNILRGKYLERGGKTPTHLNFWNNAAFRSFLDDHVAIEREFTYSTFPWMLFLCKFK